MPSLSLPHFRKKPCMPVEDRHWDDLRVGIVNLKKLPQTQTARCPPAAHACIQLCSPGTGSASRYGPATTFPVLPVLSEEFGLGLGYGFCHNRRLSSTSASCSRSRSAGKPRQPRGNRSSESSQDRRSRPPLEQPSYRPGPRTAAGQLHRAPASARKPGRGSSRPDINSM